METLKKIVHIDDDEEMLELVSALLSYYGVEVVSLPSASKDMAEVLSDDVQLVLLDMMMPEDNGLDVIDRIVAAGRSGGPSIPIVFLTRRASDAEQRLYRDTGAIGVIAKPFDPREFFPSLLGIWGTYQQTLSEEK